MTVESCAKSIGAARVRVARVLGLWKRWWDVALGLAEEEWVTRVAWWTVADGVVVFNVAIGVDAARAWAWILTTLANAGLVRLTMSLDGALWPAALRGRWVSNHARKTSTDGLVVLDGAVGVSSTWRRRARVSW